MELLQSCTASRALRHLRRSKTETRNLFRDNLPFHITASQSLSHLKTLLKINSSHWLSGLPQQVILAFYHASSLIQSISVLCDYIFTEFVILLVVKYEFCLHCLYNRFFLIITWLGIYSSIAVSKSYQTLLDYLYRVYKTSEGGPSPVGFFSHNHC